MSKKAIAINPSTNMIDILGHAGYTFPFAIADLIDNSIAANATEITLFLSILSDHPYLYIKDNGDGMNLQELEDAVVIGHKDIKAIRNKNDLGRYSTGLKSATSSFADNVVIASRSKNSSTNIIQLDYNYIRSSKKWEAFCIDDYGNDVDFEIDKHGTIVYCDHLSILGSEYNSNNVYEKIDDLETTLSHIFGKYILSERIKIWIEVEGSKPLEVKGWNPFGLIESKSTKNIFQKTVIYKGSSIEFSAFVLPVYNNLSVIDQNYMKGKGLFLQQGFYVYRNDRLISEGGWLNLSGMDIDQKSNYARIEVRLPINLDEEFKVNFCKNSIVIPDDLRDLFKEIAEKTRRESRNSYNYKKHPELKKVLKIEEEKIWKSTNSNKGIILSINEDHPILRELCASMAMQDRKKLFSLLSNSIPINMIQSQETSIKGYSEKELFEMMGDVYKTMIGQGKTLKEIKTNFAKMEPFKDYKDLLIKFFDDLEEKA